MNSFRATPTTAFFVPLALVAALAPAFGQTPETAPAPATEANTAPGDQTVRQGYAEIVRWHLGLAGVPAALHGPIVTLDEKGREAAKPLNEQVQALIRAVASTDVPDAEIQTMLTTLRAGLRAENERREAALAAAKKDLSYEQNPHLEKSLRLYGMMGDEAAVLDATPLALQRIGANSVPAAVNKLLPRDAAFAAAMTNFIRDNESALKPSLQRAKNLANLGRPGGAVSDEQLRAAITELRAGIAQYRQTRALALMELEAQTHYSRQPRLKAALLLLGVSDASLGWLDGFNQRGTLGLERQSDVMTGAKL